ncbi:efflux RND transporter periplasmic adaptor subunit [Candidatus Gottesmanbacteria bacterium]|nr:efflux RND transporter periplasmic adaptor subunit [Candidatus Gottesmanbacteria bacterium]
MKIIRIIKRKKILVIIIIIAIFGFLIYRNFVSGPRQKKLLSTKVSQGNLEEKMTISGTVDADEHVTLRFQTAGRLTWVGVKEGDYVKKYQAIASLDQIALQKTLQKELNDYLSTRWDLDQAKRDTYKDQVITDPIKRIIDKYQFTLNKSVLDVEIQNLAIDYANLWTPIEGVVTRVSAPYGGVNIIPTQAEFEVVNPKTIYFSASADQTEVVKLTENMGGELTLDSYPEATLPGTIKNISFLPKADETGTVYKVKFIFPNDNTDYKYRLGMAGDLSFVTKRKENVLYVPSKFITSQNGLPAQASKKYVTVKKKDKEEKVEVITGMETDSDTEITSGVTAGETVYD